MATKDFAHLHVHTEYSMLDGAARLGDLFSYAKELGMTTASSLVPSTSGARPRPTTLSPSSAWRRT